MDNVTLGALKRWMRSVTSFFVFFLSLFELKEGPCSTKTFPQIANIPEMFTDINFLEFKPLAIAEAALILSCPIQFPCFFKEICHFPYTRWLMECYKSINEREVVEEEKGSNETAVNVLDIDDFT
ncbi:unnamed protein product [Eruca vesicaria subsp. sativa]|uniref:Secreted protein n=1 Tax=Eruca vesicaria subsp. sativa TaxID=29727 RepID=A0ABC8JXJ3_ERUVS|nr:unnamed protein product [Eruca vesicaria subsp. sativa]